MIRQSFDILLAGALLAGAFLLLRYFIRLLANAGGLNAVQWIERWQLERAIEQARRADRLLADGRPDLALDELRTSFHLNFVTTAVLAGRVRNHHSGVLSRLLAITAEYQGGTVRLLSLAKVDRLLNERHALQSSLIAVRQSNDRPRFAQVTGKLAENRQDLEDAIRQLVAEVRQIQRSPVFH